MTALTRHDSKSSIADGVSVKKVNYDDVSSLSDALIGQDALIITMGTLAPPDSEIKLYEAAAKAGVPWVLPNEYGYDDSDESVDADTAIGVRKKKNREVLEQLKGPAWLGVACGFWYEFSLAGGPDRFGFDLDNRSVIMYGDGNVPLSTSTWQQSARAVAAALSLPLLPYDESDKSITLSQYRNKFIRFESFRLTQRDMLNAICKATETSEPDWKITHVDVKEYWSEARKRFQEGDYKSFGQMLYSRMFYPDAPGAFDTTDNEALGLPTEDYVERAQEALKMHQSGFLK